MILVPHLPYRVWQGITEPSVNLRAFENSAVQFVENDAANTLSINQYVPLAIAAATAFDPTTDKVVMVGHPLKQSLLLHYILLQHPNHDIMVGVYDKQEKGYKYESIKTTL